MKEETRLDVVTITINGEQWVRASSVVPPPTIGGDPPYTGCMLIETVTKYFIGTVVAVLPQEIVLSDACWVADTGRYHKLLAEGGDSNTEFEPCPDGLVIVGRGAIVSAQAYAHGNVRTAK
jgi:hypothetical protein